MRFWIFFQKNTIFSKITAKKNFGGLDHFSGNVALDDENEYTFSMGNGVPNTVSEFSPQKRPYGLNESWKPSFGGAFSPMSAVL